MIFEFRPSSGLFGPSHNYFPPSGASDHASTSSRNLLRFTIESRNTARHRQRSRSTSPGSPPPLPRSRRHAGEWVVWPPNTEQSRKRERSEAQSAEGLKNPAPSIPRGRGVNQSLFTVNYAGATTTKRRGSSPSDRVTTFGFSDSASCTALRSAADMGSSARSSPVSMTSVATCWANRPSAATRRSRYCATSTRIRSVRLGLFAWTTVRVTSCSACRVVPARSDQDAEFRRGIGVHRKLDRLLVQFLDRDLSFNVHRRQEPCEELLRDGSLFGKRNSFGHSVLLQWTLCRLVELLAPSLRREVPSPFSRRPSSPCFFSARGRSSRPALLRGRSLSLAGSTRALGAWSARTNASSHPASPRTRPNSPGLGLFDYFNFGVVAVHTQVGEGSVRRLFNCFSSGFYPIHGLTRLSFSLRFGARLLLAAWG